MHYLARKKEIIHDGQSGQIVSAARPPGSYSSNLGTQGDLEISQTLFLFPCYGAPVHVKSLV